MISAVYRAMSKQTTLYTHCKIYSALGLALISFHTHTLRHTLLSGSAYAETTNNIPLKKPAPHKRTLRHKKDNSPQLPHFTNQAHSGDPLLNGLPSGWSAHVIGVGAKEGGQNTNTNNRSPSTTPSNQNNNTGEAQAHFHKDPTQEGVKSSPDVSHSKNRILIPVSYKMGIAAYQSGSRFIIVVDAKKPMDTSALRGDGIFTQVAVTTLPELTIISLPIPDTRFLYLSQQPDGWVLGDQPPPGQDYFDRREISPTEVPHGVLFPMRQAGRVFSIQDPTSGTHLTVGTTTLDDGGMLSFRKGKDYDVWPSLEGVVIADHKSTPLEMKATPQGDLLSALDDKSLSDMDRALYSSKVDLEWLGLRKISLEEAEKRYKKAVLDASDAAPKDRFNKRFNAAQAALGAGAPLDAKSIMNVALEDDPEEAFRPDVKFFSNATDFLNGRIREAAPLAQDWPDQDIRATRLWKGLYHTQTQGHEKEAARLLAQDIDRLLNYPEPLRSSLLPIAAEHIARYGTAEEMKELDKIPQGDAYQFPRAMRDMRLGKKDDAIQELEHLSLSHDPTIAEKAMEEGITLSLQDGHLTAEKAADQYTSLLPDSILSGREEPLNIRRSEANIAAKQWEKALSALSQAELSPSALTDPRIKPLYGMALKGIANDVNNTDPNHPLDHKSLLHKAALMKGHIADTEDGADKSEILMSYGRLLEQLGLPEQAGTAFASAIPMVQDPNKRAEAGDELARNLIQRGLYQDANNALDSTASRPMLPIEAARRNRLIAKMTADSGKPEVALFLLNVDNDPESADLRAKIHEDSNEWSPALTDLKIVVNSYIPEKGSLNAEQQLLALRFASDASRAGDTGSLDWIKNRIGDRSFDGETGQMFQLLVSPE